MAITRWAFCGGDDNPVLPYNLALAEAWLQYLKKRFRRDPELEVKYRNVIQECVDKGMLEG